MKQGRTLRRPNARTGIALVWLILMLPVLFLLLCFVVEIGNLWLARAELETALESAALAAAKEWGDAGSSSNTSTPRQVAQAFAAANTVRGQPISLVLNYNAAGVPNRNAAVTGDGAQLVFGAITSTSPTVVFNASVEPSCSGGGAGQFAVRAHAAQTVPAICNSLFGSFSVQTDATARYDCAAGRVSVIRVDEFRGP